MVRKSSQIPQREHNKTRMRRAESWLELSKKSESDDEKFIFLWIAFNSAYGTELPNRNADEGSTERRRFTEFVEEIVKRDHKKAIEKYLWEEFSGPVRILLENKFVFGPFWEWVQERQNEKSRVRKWESKFEERKQQVHKALGDRNVPGVLEEVLARLYVLRNQIFHGGITFEKGWGRDQVKLGRHIMAALMPLVLQIMKDDIKKYPDSNVWGKLEYPRVGDE